jgi:hypothetical protein
MIKLRTSSSIVSFRERAEKALKLERYDWKTDKPEDTVVFLGLYHKGDFDSFKRPRAKRYVLWSGGDIQNFKRGYLYGDGKGLWKSKITSVFPFYRRKIRRIKAEHFCENQEQREELAKLGIDAKVRPAFWGDIKEFPISFKKSEPFKVWICGHPQREKEYGFDQAERLAEKFPEIEFHFYGADPNKRKNIFYHGIISEKQFNQEIRNYHCFLRLNNHDGLSDALIKAVLMGQHIISKVKHKFIPTYKTEQELEDFISWALENQPSLKARKYYIKHLNNYGFANN